MIIKNSNLRSNLFENRYMILGLIIAIILVLFGIRTMSAILRKQNVNTQQENTVIRNYKPQDTVISGSDIKKETQQVNTQIIDNFIKYCNEKNIEKAYELLTPECKEKVFNSSIEQFNKNYVETIFDTKKSHIIQSWINGDNVTYRVQILNDILASGKVGDETEDYYTIVKKDGQYKLNINQYIGKVDINKEETKDDIRITVISKDVYKEYETYQVKIQNNTENTILLDSKEQAKSVYLSGKNNSIYSAFMYEIDDIFLSIKPYMYRTIDVRCNKIYDGNKIESITFSDIIKNVEEYNKLSNKKDYNERLKIKVKF